MKIEFYKHCLDQKDIDRVCQTLRSVFLTAGPVTQSFEEQFSVYTDIRHTVALNSCTGALHLALLALDIGPGDEVITTPMTFIATATVIMHVGAKPVFVDVEKDTGLIDINQVEQAITPRTKAVMPVHLYGTMVDMRRLKAIADKHGLKIIEDCAHCIEGKRDGIRPGHLGDIACYSFYATKNLTCGEGGALCTNSREIAEKVHLLKQHGMSKDAASRYSDNYRHWDMLTNGWKYNLNDILASLLVGQIARLDGNLKLRQDICAIYDDFFEKYPKVSIPKITGTSARHLYTIWVNPQKRDQIIYAFQEKGVGVAVNYRAIHSLTFFRDRFSFKDNDFPNAYRIGSQTISIPLYPRLEKKSVDYILDTAMQVVI